MPPPYLFSEDEMSKLDLPPDQANGPEPARFIPSRIISGGQTGVDRAGLDAAIALGIEHGGWCPKGRLAEDGAIPATYRLHEMSSTAYPPRTRENVKDSEATLILYGKRAGDGTRLTQRVCQQLRRPCLMVNIHHVTAEQIQAWLNRYRPETLNIAGTRESISPGIQLQAKKLLVSVFTGS